MSNLSTPTQGIIAYENIKQAYQTGYDALIGALFTTLSSTYYETWHAAVKDEWIIRGLVDQIRLRDEYILKCLKDMGIEPTPQRENLPDWNELIQLENHANEVELREETLVHWNVIDEAMERDNARR